MTQVARTSALSLFAHAVDDAGALCGARPKRGRWRRSEILPVNCPKCLVELSRERLATCETPTGGVSRRHIRRVGPEGICTKGSFLRAKTLCGNVAGWDLKSLSPADLEDSRCCRDCRRILRDERRGLRLVMPETALR